MGGAREIKTGDEVEGGSEGGLLVLCGCGTEF